MYYKLYHLNFEIQNKYLLHSKGFAGITLFWSQGNDLWKCIYGHNKIETSHQNFSISHLSDKNPDNLEEVKAKFLEVQQAYEVLIDPQERAWYDKHREAILKGGLGHGEEYKDDAVNVFAYFNTSCYKGTDSIGST